MAVRKNGVFHIIWNLNYNSTLFVDVRDGSYNWWIFDIEKLDACDAAVLGGDVTLVRVTFARI